MWKTGLLLAVGAAGGGAALAVASVPDSNGVIHACVAIDRGGNVVTTVPNLTVIDTDAGQTCDTTTSTDGVPPSQTNLTWNQSGPVGPTGSQGPAGSTGSQGPRGKSITIAGGHTFTIGGSVVTVGSSSKGVTVVTPPLAPNAKALGTVTLHKGGRSTLTFRLFSWNFGASHASGGGGGAARAQIHDIVITKHVDTSSPKLAVFCASGKHIPRVTIALRKAGRSHPYLVVTLQDAMVSSFQTEGGHDQPTESISLNYSKVEFEYHQ